MTKNFTGILTASALLILHSASSLLAAQVDESAPGSRSYYIDPVHGSDTLNDGTFALPWRSFSNLSTYDWPSAPAKKQALAAGDCVYVMDGVVTGVNYVYGTEGIGAVAYFRGAWDGCRGEAGKPIRIKAYPGTHPILDAQNQGYGLMLDGCDHWDVSGLTIRNAVPVAKLSDGRITVPEGGALYVVGSMHVKLHDLEIRDTLGVPGQNNCAFVAKAVYDLEFYNNSLHDMKELQESAGKVVRAGADVFLHATDGPAQNGILARIFNSEETGSGDEVFHHNEFYFSNPIVDQGSGLGFKHGNRDLTKSVEIHDNRFRNCRSSAMISATPNTHFHHNVIAQCETGMASSSLGGGPGGGTFLVNHTFEYNTIYDIRPNGAGQENTCGYWFGNQEPVSPANAALERQDITIRKNIIVDLRSGIADVVVLNPYLSDAEFTALRGEFTLTGNCYYAPGGTARYSIAGSPTFGALGAFYTDFAAWRSATGYDAGSIAGQDPLFVAAAQGDFHLLAGTPCPDAGAFPRDPSDTTAPATPTGLAVFPDAATTLYLHWDEPADFADIAGYRLYRDGAMIHDGVTTNFLDTGLDPLIAYQYTVLAYDRAGNASALSGSASSDGPGVPPANTAPTISAIADRTVAEDGATGALAFTVADAETAAASLTVTRASSNTTLVPTANVVLGGSGANRTVSVAPAAGRSGTAMITLTVSDGSLSAQETFLLTVSADTTPPATPPAAAETPGGGGADRCGTGGLACLLLIALGLRQRQRSC